MHPNTFLAATNIVAALPLFAAADREDWYTVAAFSFVTTFSVLSHYFECHKHCMPGHGASVRVSYALNRLDVLGLFAVLGRAARIVWLAGLSPFGQDQLFLLVGALAFALLRMSENAARINDMSFRDDYIRLHSAWHVLAYVTAWMFLRQAYSVEW